MHHADNFAATREIKYGLNRLVARAAQDERPRDSSIEKQ
jgi:hypothetical protein